MGILDTMDENFAHTAIEDEKFGFVSSDSVCPDMFIFHKPINGKKSVMLDTWYLAKAIAKEITKSQENN